MAKTGKIRLSDAVKTFGRQKEDQKIYFSGILGFLINGQYIVEVPNRPGFVYVRLRDNLSEVIQAYNDAVSPVYGLPVLVSRDTNDPTRYIVVDRETARYSNWQSSSSYVPRHANQHSFNPDTGGGGDVVWVYDRQFMPLLVTPSGSMGAGGVIINADTIWQQDTWRAVGGTGTASLLGYKPTGSSAILLLVYIDENGNPQTTAGNFFAGTITGTSAIIPYLPSVPNSYDIPLGAVRLVSGTSRIVWDNIYDLRAIFRNATLTGTATAHVIQDDGSPLTQRPNLNFVGNGFVVYDNGSNTTVVSGTASGVSTPATPHAIPILDGGVFKVTGSSINFMNNLSVSVSGGQAQIFAPDNAIRIYDSGVFKITGSAISFDNSLVVTVTGSSAFVNAFAPTGTSAMVQLSKVNVSVPAGSITFSSIPNTYNTLKLMFSGKSNLAGSQTELLLQVNGSSAYQYNYALHYWLGTTAQNASIITGTYAIVGYVPGLSGSSGLFGLHSNQTEITIINPNTSNFTKMVRSDFAWANGETNANFNSGFAMAEVLNLSAISSITLSPNVGNFTSGTVATLYGIT